MDIRLGDVWARALDYADMTNTQFPDRRRMADLTNVSLARLHYMMINSSQNYESSTYSFSSAGGTELYDLPKDFYKLIKLYSVDGDCRRVVRRVSMEQLGGLHNTPSQVLSMEMHYAPAAPQFAQPADENQILVTNYPAGFDALLAMEVALSLLKKAEKPTGPLKEERDQFMQLIITVAEPRDYGEPPVVNDVYARWRRPWPFLLVRPMVALMRYNIEGNKLRLVETRSAELQ